MFCEISWYAHNQSHARIPFAGANGSRNASQAQIPTRNVPAGGTSAAKFSNEKFGTFSFYGQLSDKLSNLPMLAMYTVPKR
jgi:hypothetical protein